MKPVVADPTKIAYCGLFCGACKKYLDGRCPGCHQNERAAWCKVRTCCIDNAYRSCADCKLVSDMADCKKLNNPIAWLFGVIFRSDRNGCLKVIRDEGYEAFAERMARDRRMALRR